MKPFRQQPINDRPQHANYAARTKFEAVAHLENLIQKGITCKFLLKSTAHHVIKRIYLPACDNLQVIEAISLISEHYEEK